MVQLTMLVVIAATLAVLPRVLSSMGDTSQSDTFIDPRFVYETLPPTPTADAAEVWRTGDLPHVGQLACGTHPLQISLELPEGPIGTFLVDLGRTILPWSSDGSWYALRIREGSPDGPVAFENTRDLGRRQLIDLTAWAKQKQDQGRIDLFPTIACGGDGWTYRPDANWGDWNIQAYNVGTGSRSWGLRNVSAWYENGVERIGDLMKYDLVILHPVTQESSDEIAILRDAGTHVAGYVSFSEEHRPPPAEPLRGDGKGPGGYDSRYVDVRDGAGNKGPDGYPDFKDAFGGRNYFTDPRSASWQRAVLDEVARLHSLGVDAVFLDTFTVSHPDLVPGVRPLVSAIRDRYPSLGIVVNTYDMYAQVGGLINAVMFESFTYAHGEALPQQDAAAKADVAKHINAIRGSDGLPTFDVFTFDYVPEVGATDDIERAASRAEGLGIFPSFWRMVDVNPVIDFRAVRRAGGVELTWRTYDASPAPEELAEVGTYEIRRLDRPIRNSADWDDATVVTGALGPGTRTFVDPSSGAERHYAIRAYRPGSSRPLIGMPGAEAR